MTTFEKQKKEALQYFSSPAYKAFFTELARKFYHRGDFGKRVGLQKFSAEERSMLFRFMGYSEWEGSTRKNISIARFIQSYEATRFAAIPLPVIIEEITGEPLVYKENFFLVEKQRYTQFEEEMEQILNGYSQYLSEEKKKSWFLIFKEDGSSFTAALACVYRALNQLPKQYEKIPYFAYQLFRNPHQLDRSTLAGRLFFDYLELLCQMITDKPDYIGEAEWENIVYEYFYLLKDDSYNAVQTNGLTAQKDGNEIEMWSAAAQAGISWNVPLKHLLETDSIRPFRGNKVLFLENSGVFSIICSAFPELPVVCSSGQFKYSVWKITEKLIASGAQIYYSGDLDPAGLHIAQKLLYRFDYQVNLLLMDVQTYQNVNKEVRISEKHLRLLNSINTPPLLEVCESMKHEKLAGYQEGLLDELFLILEQW